MTGAPEHSKPSSLAAFGALFAATVLSRLPFLSASSLGWDPDAWRVALAARHIAETGEYVASRFPGYPVHEIGSALGWQGRILALNGLTVAFSGIAVGFFGLVLRRLEVRGWVLGATAFACTPVVYLNSLVAMDYVWSVAGIVGALYFILRYDSVIAGIFIGFAIGTRLTATVTLLPLAWLVAHTGLRPLVRFLGGAALVALLCYLPSLSSYGFGFLRFSDGSLPLRIVLHQVTLEVWGVAGFFAVTGALGYVLVRRFAGLSLAGEGRVLSAWERRVDGTLLGGIALFAIAYLRLPLEAGYLIPVVPLVLAWLGMHLPHRGFVVLCLALVVSPFVLDLEADSSLPSAIMEPAVPIQFGGAEMRLLPLGPLFTERVRLAVEADRVRALAELTGSVPRPAIVLAGGLWSKLTVTLGKEGRGLVIVDSLGALASGRSVDPLSRTWPPADSTYRLPIYVLPGGALPPPGDPALQRRVPTVLR